MVNLQLLKGVVKTRIGSNKKLAELMKLEPNTVSQLLNGHRSITAERISDFKDALSLSNDEVIDIFFAS